MTQEKDSHESETPQSMFERIGGEEAIAGMVDQFYERVTADPELKPFFEHTPMDKLLRMQREFFGAALGGPIVYSGKPLSHAHHGLGITQKHFGLYVEHLLETLKRFDLSEKEILEIISRIDLYSDEITGDSSVDG